MAAEYRAMNLPPPGPFNRPETPYFSPVAARAPPRWTLFNVFGGPRTYGALLYMLLALMEGRIVEALLGVRMPRRLPASSSEPGLWGRIKDYLADLRTWSSLFYMFLMLPLGVIYFVIAAIGLSVSGRLLFGSGYALVDSRHIQMDGAPAWLAGFAHSPVAAIIPAALGVAVFFITLHVARALGWLHGRIAEHLLVRL